MRSLSMNIILISLFLPAVLWIGISSTLSDIRTGKVKNRLIKNGLLYGIIVYFLLFCWSMAKKHSVFLAMHFGKTYYLSFNYFAELIVNAFIALVVGILLWKMDFWAAGDAKLFALLSFLLPLTVYSHEEISYFPSFILLLNIYTLSLFYLIFIGIFKLKIKITRFSDFYKKVKQKVTDSFKKIQSNLQIAKILNYVNLILIYSIIFSIIFSLKLKINILNISISSQLMVYLALFLIYTPLSSLLNTYKTTNFFIFPLLIMLSFFVPHFWVNLSFRLNPFIRFFSGFFIFIIIIRTAAQLLAKQAEIKKIRLEELVPNMILGDETMKLLKQDKDFLKNQVGQIYFDGLSSEQIDRIKGFLQNKNIEEVEICKTFPFAPFIFAGAIITLILQASLFKWLIQFLQR